MTRITKEKKLADAIAATLDTLDFDYIHCAHAFSRYGSAIQTNLFELILAFLNRWAFLYQNGGVSPGERMYTMCEMADRMVAAMTTRRRLP